MEFRTAVNIAPLRLRVTHKNVGLALGSCFAENIASRMVRGKLPVTVNPFGVLFNPASIASALGDLASGRVFSRGEMAFHDGLWFSFSHHGSFSSPDPEAALAAMNQAAARGTEALRLADYAIITLGTAWVYVSGASGRVVANCHKLPASEFTRRRMGVEEITEVLGGAVAEHLAGKRVVLTVSPVRHIKDGLVENMRSKASLIEACHRIAESSDSVEYFPSYEILTDELRDYRFYDRDMVHPSDVAVDFIWGRFAGAVMDTSTRSLMAEAERIAEAASHRPLHEGSTAHEAFRAGMLAKAQELAARHPEIDMSSEIDFFGL